MSISKTCIQIKHQEEKKKNSTFQKFHHVTRKHFRRLEIKNQLAKTAFNNNAYNIQGHKFILSCISMMIGVVMRKHIVQMKNKYSESKYSAHPEFNVFVWVKEEKEQSLKVRNEVLCSKL